MAPSQKPRRPPATSVEGRQNQLLALATDLLEQRLRDGTASSQELTTIFKEGTVRAQLEVERLKIENDLKTAQIKELESREKSETLYAEAIEAMKNYKGDGDV